MSYSTVACVTTALILYIFACIALTLRLVNRFFLLGKVAMDDYLAILATVTYTGLSIIYVIGVISYGLGNLALDVPRNSYATGLKIVFVGELLCFVATYLIKLSFVFTLLRIVVYRAHRVVLFTLLAAGLTVTLVGWFWALFFCQPVRYFWAQAGPDPSDGSCKSIASLMSVLLAHAAWTLVADVILGVVIPTALLWESSMQWKLKASVYVLLGLGSVASIATIARIIYLPRLSRDEALLTNNPAMLWSNIETGISIIATSTATMKRLLVKITGIGSHSRHSEGDASYYCVSGKHCRHGQSVGTGPFTQPARVWPSTPIELDTRRSSIEQILEKSDCPVVSDKDIPISYCYVEG